MTSSDNIEKLSVRSQHPQPVSELFSSFKYKLLRTGLDIEIESLYFISSGILDAVPKRLESLVKWSKFKQNKDCPRLYLREVSTLVHGELCPGKHLLQAVQHVWPEVVLLHAPALVVDLVQHIHYPAMTRLDTFQMRQHLYSDSVSCFCISHPGSCYCNW